MSVPSVPLESVRFFTLHGSNAQKSKRNRATTDESSKPAEESRDRQNQLAFAKELHRILTHEYYTRLDPADRDDLKQSMFASLGQCRFRSIWRQQRSLWTLLKAEHRTHQQRSGGEDTEKGSEKDSAMKRFHHHHHHHRKAASPKRDESDESSEDSDFAQIYGVGYRRRQKRFKKKSDVDVDGDGDGDDDDDGNDDGNGGDGKEKERKSQIEFLFDESYQDHFRHVPLFAHSLMGSWVVKETRRIGYMLAHRPHYIRAFFRYDTDACRLFFDPRMITVKTHGGYALQNYALSHRDTVWEKLVWRNRIVSPVVAVQNLHRFFELDIDATMKSLLEDEIDFWRSGDFRRCAEEGEYLSLNPTYWIRVLYAEMMEGNSRISDELKASFLRFLEKENCQNIICNSFPYLENDLVIQFLKDNAPNIIFPEDESKNMHDLVFRYSAWDNISDLTITALALLFPFRLNRCLRDESDASTHASVNIQQALSLYRMIPLSEEDMVDRDTGFNSAMSLYASADFEDVQRFSFAQFLAMETFVTHHILSKYYSDVNRLFILLKENAIPCEEIHGEGDDTSQIYKGPDSILLDVYDAATDDSDEERVKRGRKRKHKKKKKLKSAESSSKQHRDGTDEANSAKKIFLGWKFHHDSTQTIYTPDYVPQHLSFIFAHTFSLLWRRHIRSIQEAPH